MARTRSTPYRRSGFSLLEASLVIVIVGVAVTAMLELLASGTRSNSEAATRTTALTVARGVREHALALTFDQVLALNGQTYSPAVDAGGSAVPEFADWQQTVQVQPVDPSSLLSRVSTTTPEAVCVTVHAVRHGQRAASLSWYQFRPH